LDNKARGKLAFSAVVDQRLPNVPPECLAGLQADHVKAPDLDAAGASPALDPEQFVPDLRERPALVAGCRLSPARAPRRRACQYSPANGSSGAGSSILGGGCRCRASFHLPGGGMRHGVRLERRAVSERIGAAANPVIAINKFGEWHLAGSAMPMERRPSSRDMYPQLEEAVKRELKENNRPMEGVEIHRQLSPELQHQFPEEKMYRHLQKVRGIFQIEGDRRWWLKTRRKDARPRRSSEYEPLTLRINLFAHRHSFIPK
jgi:hypothetical protein